MKRILLFSIFLTATLGFSFGQGTYSKVYALLQTKCVTCHSNANPSGGLSLEGTGANQVNRESSVHTRIVNANPSNGWAVSKNLKLISPGRVDKSYLFHKINRGLEPTLAKPDDGGVEMPQDGNPQLTNAEKELVRQWILYGAPRLGTVVDEQVINNFYNGQALKSFPDGPPPAPAAGQGFQIKMGPFYLNPLGQINDELEYFTKYKLDLPSDLEVNRIEVLISNYSHHFIIYNFNPGGDQAIPNGFRLNPNHTDIGLVAAVQGKTDLKLPEGTAFKWRKDLVLDLNSHYINYSATNYYQAEAYLNIYTQPIGTAKQEMKTFLLPNENIPIPNTGDVVAHSQVLNFNAGEIFVWGIMGHTHKYGTDYKVYKRTNGARNEMLYDASCSLGIPGCSSPYFNYRHIPMRYFSPLYPLTFNASNGIIHEAKWVNNGPASVNFGPTSEDEMMVLVLMYTLDTTGVRYTALKDFPKEIETEISIIPNPFNQSCIVDFSQLDGKVQYGLSDLCGRVLFRRETMGGGQVEIERGDLLPGIYFLQITDRFGRRVSKKIVVQ